MLPKKNRLKDTREFQIACLRGKFTSSGPITLKIAQNNRQESRFGFAIGKSYSKKATERNTAKRILRAAIAPFVNRIVPGLDIVLGVRKFPSGQKLTTKTISAAISEALKRNNLLK